MEISTTNKIKKSLAIHRLFQFLGGKKDRVVCGLVANCEAAATQFRQMGWRPPECREGGCNQIIGKREMARRRNEKRVQFCGKGRYERAFSRRTFNKRHPKMMSTGC